MGEVGWVEGRDGRNRGGSDGRARAAAVTTVLAIRPTAGGRQLYDPGTGAEYAIQSGGAYDGCYVDSAGSPLTVDKGYTVGGYEVGPQRAYGLLTAVVVGSPATARRSGFDSLSASDYIIVVLDSASTHTAIAKTTMATDASPGSAPFFGADASGDRWGILANGPNSLEVKLLNSSGQQRLAQVVSGGMYAAAATTYTAGRMSSDGSMYAEAWNASGSSLGSQVAATYTLTDPDGVYYIGRDRGGSGTFGQGTIDMILGWDGSTVDEAAVVADLVAGATVDDICDDYMPDMCTDGAVSGAIDRTDLTALPYIGAEGDGTPVAVVEVTL